MKIKIFLFLLFLFLLVNNILSQDSWAKPGKKGIFIRFGNELPRGFNYQLERKEEKNTEWKLLQVAAIPKSQDEVKARSLIVVAKNPFYGTCEESEISHFWSKIKTAKTFDSLYSYASRPVFIELAGLGYFDTEAKPGIKYVYRVSKVSNQKVLTFDVIKPDVFPGQNPNYNYKFSNVEANGITIKLKWKFSKGIYPYGIRVFRDVYLQTNPEEIFPKITFVQHGDSVLTEIVDNEVSERITYRYTVVPFDVLGNEMPPSDAVIVLNVKPYGEAVVLKRFKASSCEKEGAIKLSWSYHSPKPMNNITIYKSESFDNGYEELTNIPAKDTVFMDYHVDPVKSYYYFLVFNNVYGQSPPTNKIIGMLKPVRKASIPPQMLRVMNTSEGNRLAWQKPDFDSKRYYIYRGNGYKSKMSQIAFVDSDSSTVYFTDKKENLIPGVNHSYTISCENTSSFISAKSDTVFAMATPKDIPVPLNLRVIPYGKNVMLIWDDMKGIAPEIRAYRIYRYENENNITSSSKVICSFSEYNNYIDTIKDDIQYSYSVACIMDLNIEGKKSTVALYSKKRQKPFPPAGLRAIPTGKSILIHWDKPDLPDIKEYRIYRTTSGGKPELISSLKADTVGYTDNSVKKGVSYFYCISTVNFLGQESIKSDELGTSIQ